jgi:hypothetical protein
MTVMVLALAGAIGCDLVEEEQDGLRRVSSSQTSDAQGTVSFTFNVADDEDAFLLTAEVSGNGYAVVYELVDPDGETVVDAEKLWTQVTSRTGGVYPAGVVSVNWPIQASDGDLKSGRWTAVIRTTDAEYYYKPGVETTIDVLKKTDNAFAGGGLDIRIFYAGGVDQDPAFVASTEAATEYWKEMYANIGVEASFTYQSWQNGALPPPGEGADAEYEAIANASSLSTVNVVIVPSIDGYEGGGLYGIAGGIPGPLVPTGNSAVTVDALTNAGPDMAFNDAELQLYGETMAHEVGHFIGLFHPVETDYAYFDAVDDTPQCNNRNNCEGDLGGNLMFPYPVCTFSSCVQQDDLTAGQGEIAQRYAGVD